VHLTLNLLYYKDCQKQHHLQFVHFIHEIVVAVPKMLWDADAEMDSRRQIDRTRPVVRKRYKGTSRVVGGSTKQNII
jgi:hypothetical protein